MLAPLYGLNMSKNFVKLFQNQKEFSTKIGGIAN